MRDGSFFVHLEQYTPIPTSLAPSIVGSLRKELCVDCGSLMERRPGPCPPTTVDATSTPSTDTMQISSQPRSAVTESLDHPRPRRWRRTLEFINELTPTWRDAHVPDSHLHPGTTSCSLGWVLSLLPSPALPSPHPIKDQWLGWTMRYVTGPHALSAYIDASCNSKNFTGSTNGSLTSFLGIPFAKPPYGPMTIRFYHVLTPAQHGKQAFLSS